MALGEAEIMLRVKCNMWIPGNPEADPEAYKKRLQERMERQVMYALSPLTSSTGAITFEILVTPYFREVQESDNHDQPA